MPQTTYPAGSDLQVFLTANGLNTLLGSSFSLFAFGVKAAAAVAEWENAVRWFPFLIPADPNSPGNPVVTTRVFDPPGPAAVRSGNFLAYRGGGRILRLPTGLAASPAPTLGIGDPPVALVLSNGSDSFAADAQCWLQPYDAPAQGKPYREIEFLTPMYGNPAAVSVTGAFGYSPVCQDDVWDAVLKRAAGKCFSEIALGLSQGVSAIQSEETRVQFSTNSDGGPLAQVLRQWDYDWQTAVRNYRKAIV